MRTPFLASCPSRKKPELSSNITLSGDKLKKYFPKSYTPAQIENTIFKLLDSWLRKRQREESR
jgi:ParB family chromosome partitioning protein